MPLWDYEYLKFWEKVPFEKKHNQNLYKSAILESNWGDVWQNIELNPKKNIQPILSLIRFFKGFFLFIGKNKWYKFERKYIEYFTEDLHAFKPWSFYKVCFDKRGHYSPISWYIEVYLNRKKIKWNGNIND